MNIRIPALALLCLLLAGCNIPGMEDEEGNRARLEADAKATGSACRHAQRGVEDCYNLNPKAPRSAVFAGWKDMDAYMRDNKLEGQATTVQPAKEVVADAEPAEEKPAKEAKDTPKPKAKPAAGKSAPHT